MKNREMLSCDSGSSLFITSLSCVRMSSKESRLWSKAKAMRERR